MNQPHEAVADASPESDVQVMRAFETKFWQAVNMTDSREFDHDVCHEVRDFRALIERLATQPGASAGVEERALLECIDRYWKLAYAEGKEGRDHDTEAGDAQACRHEIETRIKALRARAKTEGEVGRVACVECGANLEDVGLGRYRHAPCAHRYTLVQQAPP